MKLRPLQDRVLIRPLKRETISSGAIIIPDTAKEKPVEGTVVAVGSGNRDDHGMLHAPDVMVGDRVLYSKWSGSEMQLDGEDLMIMKETDILGIVDQAAETTPAA
jgi:chaperonin GroES